MDSVTIYSTTWCPDCRRARNFLRERGVAFEEVNIEEDPAAEDLVLKVNQGKCKVPTIKLGERYFACSPFNPQKLASELNIPLNPFNNPANSK